MRNAGVVDYITDAWNLVETIQILFNLFFIGLSLVEYRMHSYPFAVLMLCLTMIKFLMQLRVFD